MIRHIVHLRFDAEVTDAQKDGLFCELSDLRGEVDGILDFQFRKNISVETHLVRDFLDMFWFDFRDENVRDAYLENRVHKEIGERIVEKLNGGLNGIFVCDIEI